MHAPVALIIFNRPDATARLVAALSKVKPKKLFVIADGPRPDVADDGPKCAATREQIERIDWDCEVVKEYSDRNLGCGKRPYTGITWLFQQTDRAVILEDDCVPDPSVFPFFDELLEQYKDDERVMHISGRGVFPERKEGPYSYYFTRSLSCWGWASWARAWRLYDYRISAWPELRETDWLEDVLVDRRAVRFFRDRLERCHINSDRISYWDLQWNFACWANSGLGIRPYVNLVSNTGFGPDATHYVHQERMRKHYDIPASAIEFPLRHPPRVLRDAAADKFALDAFFTAAAPQLRQAAYIQFMRRLKARLRRAVPVSSALPDRTAQR